MTNANVFILSSHHHNRAYCALILLYYGTAQRQRRKLSKPTCLRLANLPLELTV